jgi:ABC-type multidrug transport system permease subunit
MHPMDSQAPSRSLRRAGLELFAISFVVLFQELTLIRWLPGQVRVLAYFPNLILLGAFLGLGVGCLRAGQRSLLWLWPVSLLVLGTTGWLLSRVAFTQNSPTEHLWLLYYDLGEKAPVVGDVRLPIVLFFIFVALSFISLGQLVARRLQEFRVASAALWGYTCDLSGSLAGVVLFALFGIARTAPVIWFACIVAVGAVFFAARRRTLLGYAVASLILLGLVRYSDRASIYSPYYAISLAGDHSTDATDARRSGKFYVLTNGSLHQIAFDLQRGGAKDHDAVRDAYHDAVLTGYHLPYRCLASPPQSVLVLGAGTGNDVAVALDEGAARVDAVEIDPVILALGDRHPNHPYASPRVRKINADARTFLNETTDRYDLIVFGTLDSMTRLSALSNVRLDNFVYTRECIEAAKARLTPRGGLVMYFMVSLEHIDRRLAGMLAGAFGLPPLVAGENHKVFNRIYLSGPAFDHLQLRERLAAIPATASLLAETELPSDDWPYLYLQVRGISSFYLFLIGVFSAIAILSVALASGEMRRSIVRGGLDGEMFLFGLAFLLLETKSVTTMSLLWGATWLTSAVVFGAILAMVLAATVLVQLRPLPWVLCMGGLIVSLIAAYFVPVHALLRMNDFSRLLLSIAFVGTPIFFAAACFALLFRDRPEANTAFGWNLLGAVAGGLIEFVSMITGIRALYLLVLIAYIGVVLLRMRAAERPHPPDPVATA